MSLITSDSAHVTEPGHFQHLAQNSSFPIRPQRHLRALNFLLTGDDCEFPAWGWRAAMRKPPTNVDVLYARTRPLASAVPALIASKRSGLPLVLHFSDPAPSPWLDPRSILGQRERAFSAKLARGTTVATFTTFEAMNLQQSLIPEWAEVPSFVIPHIAPEWESSNAVPSETRFLYVGSFYAARSPRSLLEGFAAYQRKNTDANLIFLGSSGQLLKPLVKNYGLESSVDVLQPVLDVNPTINKATALVAVDSFEGPPVFMSTKFVEYLATNKPIILISPKNSPSAQLAQDERAGIYLSEADQPEAIARALERSASNLVLTEAQRRERARLLESFSAKTVARKAIEALTVALQ